VIVVTQPGQRHLFNTPLSPSVVEDVALLLTHHKAGTILLKQIANIMSEHMAGSCGYLIRKDRACQHAVEEHGTVDIDTIQDIDADCGLKAWHAIHVIRDPWEVVLSGYQYHGHVQDPIPYLYGSGQNGNGHPNPHDYSHMSEKEGLLYEATVESQSTLADMVQTFDRSREDERILTLRFEDFNANFNGTLRELYGHLVRSEEAVIETLIDKAQPLNTQTWSPEHIASDSHVMSQETRTRLQRILCDLAIQGQPAIDELLAFRAKLGYNEPLQCK